MTRRQLLFTYKGRISRKEYWRGYLLSWLFFLLPAIIIFAAMAATSVMQALAANPDPAAALMGAVSSSTIGVAALIPLPFIIIYNYNAFCLNIKRLHDLNLSGWLSLYRFVPLLFISFNTVFNILSAVGFVLYLAIGFAGGTKGANKYGGAEGFRI